MRRNRIAAVLVLSAALLAGCTGTEPAPTATFTSATATPTPTPILNPAEQLEQDNVAAAREALDGYMAAGSVVAQGGYADLSPLMGYLGGSHRQATIANLGATHDAGWHTGGPVVVTSAEVTAYDPGPAVGSEQVTFLACVDASAAPMLGPDGEIINAANPDALTETFAMNHEPDGHWTVVSEEMVGSLC